MPNVFVWPIMFFECIDISAHTTHIRSTYIFVHGVWPVYVGHRFVFIITRPRACYDNEHTKTLFEKSCCRFRFLDFSNRFIVFSLFSGILCEKWWRRWKLQRAGVTLNFCGCSRVIAENHSLEHLFLQTLWIMCVKWGLWMFLKKIRIIFWAVRMIKTVLKIST